MSRQYGFTKAIQAGKTATMRADKLCQKTVKKFNECHTPEDISAVILWMEKQNYFHASDQPRLDAKMAFDNARLRIKQAAL